MNAEHAPIALQVFARVPVLGNVKTRLIPHLGAAGALRVYRQLTERTLGVAAAVQEESRTLWFAGDPGSNWLRERRRIDPGLAMHAQIDGDLGARMHAALVHGCTEHGGAVLFGTDCPLLDADYLRAACAALRAGADLVLGPVADGGYVLVGLRQPCAALFSGVPWSTAGVLASTLAIAHRQGLATVRLPELWDVDRPADVARLRLLGEPWLTVLDVAE